MTSIARVSTYVLHQRTTRDFSDVQSHLADLQDQLSSGFKTDSFDGLVGQVEQFTAVEAQMRRVENYRQNIQESITRHTSIEKSLDQTLDIGDDMLSLMVLRRSANGNNLGFEAQLRDLRESVIRELNNSFGGRYLFSGTRTNVKPVIEPLPEPNEVGVPDANYYQGAAENVLFRADDGQQVEYEIRADNQAFQKLFAGIEQALAGDAADNDAVLGAAYTTIREAMDEVNGLATANRARMLNLNNINERHLAMQQYLKGVKENLINTDSIAVSTQVAVDQTILTATFQAFSRISGLKLSDFLG